jgi:hypothetical protein
MSTEAKYDDLTPEIDWGYCPASDCDWEIEWYEDGPICPGCGHMWDSDGHDVGGWEENMGEPWPESSPYRKFRQAEDARHEWNAELIRILTRNERKS